MKYFTFLITSEMGKCIYSDIELVSGGPLPSVTRQTLAIGARIVPALSPFHSAVPFNLRMKPATSSVTVPRRSEGINPLGPRTRPNLGVMARTRSGVHKNKLAWCLPDIIWSTCENQCERQITCTYTVNKLETSHNIRSSLPCFMCSSTLGKYENFVTFDLLGLPRQ